MKNEDEPDDGHTMKKRLAETHEDQHWTIFDGEKTKTYYAIWNYLDGAEKKGLRACLPQDPQLLDDSLGDWASMFEDMDELKAIFVKEFPRLLDK